MRKKNLDRLPPHSIEAEQGVLGCILLAPDCLTECDDLTHKHFYDLRHQSIFRAMLALQKSGKPIDLISIQQQLGKKASDAGGMGYVSKLSDDVPSAANVKYYLSIVAEKYRLRKIIQTCSEIVGRVYDYEGPVEDLLFSVNSELVELAQEQSGQKLEARKIREFTAPSPDDGTELLRKRFLSRGGGLLLIGQSGQGKSSLNIQMAACWAIGKPCFDIEPSKPLKVLIIQAENDDGDVYEMFNGICAGLKFSDEDRASIGENVFVYSEDSRAGLDFLRLVDRLAQLHRPDIIIIDPALAFIQGDTKDAEAVGNFLRRGLNPILHLNNCGAIVVHHTTKGKNDDKLTASDFLYAGLGSTEFTNWARAVLCLEGKGNGHFALHAPKRGGRIGWRSEEGQSESTRWIRHCRIPGVIFWEDDDAPEAQTPTNRPKRKTAADLLAHVPIDGTIPKSTLLDKANESGIAVHPSKAMLNQLIDEKILYVWTEKRSGTNALKLISRVPQPGPELQPTLTPK